MRYTPYISKKTLEILMIYFATPIHYHLSIYIREAFCMQAAVYARTGSKTKSINEQIMICKEFIRLEGWNVVEVYADQGISAHEQERPEMKRLLSDAFHRKFDLVVITGYDRLYRSQSFIDELIYKLHLFDIVVVIAGAKQNSKTYRYPFL
jgi:DNA invertase Pin-like site-specific DNA recombinase